MRSPSALAVSLLTLALAACSGPSDTPTRTTTTSSSWDVGGAVSGSRETTVVEPAAEASAADAIDASEAPPPPVPQSGNLTAGDHDDLLNAAQYAAYAGRFLQKSGRDLPFVDTRNRVALRVVDAAGRPVPFARIRVARDGAPLQLVTAADGVASLFPRFDHVAEQVRVTVASSAGEASRTLDLGAVQPVSRQVTIPLPGAARPVAAMDVALVLDATGSMGDEMAYLQAELDTIVARFQRDAGNLDLRIGLIVYRDEGDDYVVRSVPLTGAIPDLRAALAEQSADGGGDTPEAVDQAMQAAEALQWRPDAAKAMLLVADAPPHPDRIAATLAAVERLRARGVQIVPVAASGVEDNAQYVMRTMATLTQGRYLFLTDDSAIGDSHAEPDVSCYLVTRLDQLIARVLAGIAEGRRIEPAQGEVIRAVGDYDRGRCRTGTTQS